MTASNQDPLELLKAFWGNMGFPLPGMVTPTLDTDELGKRIADLKAVEGWLKANLSMLQMTIQGLEMQHATLAAMQGMAQGAAAEPPADAANPFADPAAFAAMWPWNFMSAGAPPESPPAEPSADEPKPKG